MKSVENLECRGKPIDILVCYMTIQNVMNCENISIQLKFAQYFTMAYSQMFWKYNSDKG